MQRPPLPQTAKAYAFDATWNLTKAYRKRGDVERERATEYLLEHAEEAGCSIASIME